MMADPRTIRQRLRRLYADYAARMNEESGEQHHYFLGKTVAIAEAYAEVFEMPWQAAQVELTKGRIE